MGIQIYPNYIFSEEWRNNATWLVLKPKKAVTVNLNAKEKGSIYAVPDEEKDSLAFLLPMEYTIPLQHRWTDSATVSGKIREIVTDMSKQYELGKGEIKNLGDVASQIKNAGWGAGANQLLEGGKADVSKFSLKNDNPVVYENSSRRSINIEIQLSYYSDIKKDVFDPIQLLMDWSSPSSVGEGKLSAVSYEYPSIFQVSICKGNSENPTTFNIDNAVITSINPTLKGPYVNGYPTSAEVQLQFEDLDPLYKKSLSTNGIVTTAVKGATK